MNKSLITFAILAAAAGTAAAQSNVTVYGKIDLGVRKAVGATNSEMATGSDGRLGFKGTEDLGGGNRAFFDLQHRFFPNTGAQDGAQFWKGLSQVGIGGAFGQVSFGRQYIAAFSMIQDKIDPFGGDTVAQLRDVGFRVGGITKVRIDSSIRYDYSTNGLNLAVSSAESTPNGGSDRRTTRWAACSSAPATRIRPARTTASCTSARPTRWARPRSRPVTPRATPTPTSPPRASWSA